MIPLAFLLTFFWVCWTFATAYRQLGFRVPRQRASKMLLLLMAGVSGILILRPNEQIEAGEDPALYFHAGLGMLRAGSLRMSDPALSGMPPEDQNLFRYGHAGFLLTKDAVFWSRNPHLESVGVFFFPAYSFLLGVPMLLGIPYAAFWLSGLVAAAAGVVLAGMTVKLTGREWTGWIAYGLFLLHPAVAWNARALRAEWPASLLVLCGLAIWLPAVLEKRKGTWGPGLLAGGALSGAMLFHMTAVYVVIPALIAGIILTRRNRFWAGWWLGLSAGFALFAAQTLWVTDPYWIAGNLISPGRRIFLLAGVGLLVVFSCGARWIYHRVSRLKSAQLGMGLLMSLGVWAVVLLILRYRDAHGHIPFLPAWTVSYISLTDFQGVLRTMSRFWFLFALAGFPILCLRNALGRWLFFLLAPASMTIGWVVNYMFETRRMVTFLVPLLILGTLSLLDWGTHALARCLPVRDGVKSRVPPWGAILVMLLIAAFAVRDRSQIFTTWNFKGMHGFYRTLSARIQPEADFLFAEYTQTAVPIEKITGLPLLPLAWEYRSDAEIEQIQSIWRDMVSDRPDRRHVLISPFAGSAIPGVAMELLWTESVRTRTLGRARRDVPKPVHRWTRTLHAHRLLPPGEVAPRTPYLREFHGSRLGIRGAANRMGPRATELRGNRLDTDEPVRIPWGDTQEFVLLIAYPHGVPGALPEINGGTVHRVKMGRHWEALWVQAEGSDVLSMRSEHFSFLVQLFERQGSTLNPAVLPAEAVSFGIDDLDSQWVRAEAALLVPEHPGLSWIWIYAQHSRSDPEPVRVTLFKEDGSTLGDLSVTAEWAWHPVAVEHPEDARGVFAWMKLQTLPAYDPGLSNFPSDLGIRMHQFVVDPQP